MGAQRLELWAPQPPIAPRETLEMAGPRCSAKGENDRAGRDRNAAHPEDRLHTWPPRALAQETARARGGGRTQEDDVASRSRGSTRPSNPCGCRLPSTPLVRTDAARSTLSGAIWRNLTRVRYDVAPVNLGVLHSSARSVDAICIVDLRIGGYAMPLGPCSNCSGTGGFPCANCEGCGFLPCAVCSGRGLLGYGDTAIPCGPCRGTGKYLCSTCGGRGHYRCPECSGGGMVNI